MIIHFQLLHIVSVACLPRQSPRVSDSAFVNDRLETKGVMHLDQPTRFKVIVQLAKM
jgi:hypothetical protein